MSPGGLAEKLLAFVGIVLLIQLGLVAWMLAADSGIDWTCTYFSTGASKP